MIQIYRHRLYVWLSPFTVHLKLSQHCYLAIPQYKIKSSKRKKKKMYRYGQIPLPMGKISHLVFFFSSHTQKSYHLHFFFLMWKGESNNAGLVRPCLFNFHGVSSPFSHYQDNHKRWLGQDFIFSPRWKSYDSERFHDWPKEGRQGEVTLEARSSDSSWSGFSSPVTRTICK